MDTGPEQKIFGKYRLLEEIGRGGMGVVYRAEHVELRKIVAVKMLKAPDFATESQLAYFHREIESMAKLSHPNIISIHDIGAVGNQRYFAMEYLDGCTLDELMNSQAETGPLKDESSYADVIDHIRRKKALSTPSVQQTTLPAAADSPPPVPQAGIKVGRFRALREGHALTIMQKLIRAVEHAHGKGVIHRDIKPSNVMMTKSGEPLLMDFGLARDADPGEGAALTKSGQILGTPMYMSPEQAGGEREKINERTDIYGLGAVFYEMLTGRPPFIPSGNPLRDITLVIEGEFKPIRQFNPSVSRELAVICEKAMEKDPERRYRTAAAFAEDLRRYMSGDPILARPQGVLYRLKKKIAKARAVAVSGSVVAAVLAAALYYWNWSSRALEAEKAKAEARWIPVYENDFSGGFDSLNWVYVRPDLNNMEYGVRDGRLFMRNKGALYSRIKVPGNIKIVFDAMVKGGNEITLNIKVDSIFGEKTFYYRFFWGEEIVKWKKEGMTAYKSPVQTYFNKEEEVEHLWNHFNEWFRVELSFENGICRALINGKPWVETEDPFPVSSADNSRWGFRSLLGEIWVDNLRVFRQVLPQRVDVTAMADVYIQTQQPDAALRHLLQIVESYDDPAMLLRVIKKIMAIGQTWPGAGAYEALLSRAAVCRKAMETLDEKTSMKFLEALLDRFASDAARRPQLMPLLDIFAAKMDADRRFSFYVFLGMAFSQAGNAAPAEAYFRQALVIRGDKDVQRYVDLGVIPADRESRGAMKRVPGGYLPYAFGECSPVRPFYMDTTEVTGDLFSLVTGRGSPGPFPVGGVTWYDAVLFCNARSRREGLDTCYAMGRKYTLTDKRKAEVSKAVPGHPPITAYVLVDDTAEVFEVVWNRESGGYRLPTVEEFEYALRSGSTGAYYQSSRPDSVPAYAWCEANSDSAVHPVATRRPNRFGLYDLIGNMKEWCWTDGGKGCASGGNFNSAPAMLTNRVLMDISAIKGSPEVGFRCVRNAEK